MKSVSAKFSPFDSDLDVFKVVFDVGQLSRASEVLGIDQGNLSRILRRLEACTGVRLFDRYHRGVRPTAEASALRENLDRLSKLWSDVRGMKAGEQFAVTPLRVGCHPSIARSYLSKVLPTLNAQPNLSIHLRFETSTEITRLVMERELDLGIVVNPIKSPALVVKKFASEQVELASRESSGRQGNKTLLVNPDMIFVRSFVEKLNFSKLIEVRDYETMAEIANTDSSFIALLPSGVRKRFPKLQALVKLHDKIDVSLISYPGSTAIKLIPLITK